MLLVYLSILNLSRGASELRSSWQVCTESTMTRSACFWSIGRRRGRLEWYVLITVCSICKFIFPHNDGQYHTAFLLVLELVKNSGLLEIVWHQNRSLLLHMPRPLSVVVGVIALTSFSSFVNLIFSPWKEQYIPGTIINWIWYSLDPSFIRNQRRKFN